MAEVSGGGAWNVFSSYSHKDDRIREKIDEHLSLLKRQGLISSWHDHDITAGKGLDDEIIRHLEQADIILLLVSSAFIASNYCFCTELQQALRRHEAGLARVVPIIVKPCDWKSSPLGKLKALPQDGKAITKWKNRDDAYLNVALGIREIVKELNARKMSAPDAEKPEASSSEPCGEVNASLSAYLAIGGDVEVLREIGCPYLKLRLVCTSKRPAKIYKAELRIKGSQYITPFQNGFGTDFGHTPLQGPLSDDDSLAVHLVPASWPNVPATITIERDEAYTFILPGFAFPIPIFTQAAPADVSVVVTFLDGRTQTVLNGRDVQAQISGLLDVLKAKRYSMNPMFKTGFTLYGSSKTAPDFTAVGSRNKSPVVLWPLTPTAGNSAVPSGGKDVFGDFPELTAIGREALQEHCNEWLKTSIARQSRTKEVAIAQVGPKLVIGNIAMECAPDIQPGETLHFPLDYLLNYLIERIVPPDRQARLMAIVALKRFNAGPAAYQQFKVAPRMPLGVKCKNAECGEVLLTQLKGYHGQPFITDIEPVTCPKCGEISSFEAKDFFVLPDGVFRWE
jgi:TIR domain